MKRTKVCVLSGGVSGERQISERTAKQILDNINTQKYDAYRLDISDINGEISKSWVMELYSNPPDVVVSALHGGIGENGSVQGLLECLAIPYVGSKVIGSGLCMNKSLAKLIMKSCHIPVPSDILVDAASFSGMLNYYEGQIVAMGERVAVKPNRGGSSLGITIVDDPERLICAVTEAGNFDNEVLIEQYIAGDEVTCAIAELDGKLQVVALLDIHSKQNNIFDYTSKYETEEANADISKLPLFLQTMIIEMAKKAFVSLKCKGYACVDMILHEEQVYVLEVNTLPGMTRTSLMPRAVHRYGLNFGEFIDRLITAELK